MFSLHAVCFPTYGKCPLIQQDSSCTGGRRDITCDQKFGFGLSSFMLKTRNQKVRFCLAGPQANIMWLPHFHRIDTNHIRKKGGCVSSALSFCLLVAVFLRLETKEKTKHEQPSTKAYTQYSRNAPWN